MNGTSIRYVAIWPGGLRLAHWLLAAGVLFCLASGWALQQLPADPAFWHDWHIITGQITALALLLRSVLLFVPGSTHWRALLPKRGQWQACRQMLRFYLSLGRAPLPAWYAHNPLWAPVYLLVLAVEAACLATGFGYSSSWQLLKVPVAQLHSGSATALALFTLAHLAASALHDWKGNGALISAMISGKRYFHIRPPQSSLPDSDRRIEVSFTTRNTRQ